MRTSVDCLRTGGTYSGDATNCAPNNCPQPVRGACCITYGQNSSTARTVCGIYTPEGCASQAGAYQGDGSTCGPPGCPAPTFGACCIPVTSSITLCSPQTPERCAFIYGSYQGDGSTCRATQCEQGGRGACCFSATSTRSAHCRITSAFECPRTGGTYGGNDSACTAKDCPGQCACDWNGNGLVDSGDLYEFIQDWLNGRADFNNDGTTDQQDLAEFGSCFQMPPTGCF